MPNWTRSDVVLVDLGYAAKVRPCVVLSIQKADSKRNITVVAPLTTEARGGECEVPFAKPPWLMDVSVINVIGIGGVDNAKFGRVLGRLSSSVMEKVDEVLYRLLDL